MSQHTLALRHVLRALGEGEMPKWDQWDMLGEDAKKNVASLLVNLGEDTEHVLWGVFDHEIDMMWHVLRHHGYTPSFVPLDKCKHLLEKNLSSSKRFGSRAEVWEELLRVSLESAQSSEATVKFLLSSECKSEREATAGARRGVMPWLVEQGVDCLSHNRFAAWLYFQQACEEGLKEWVAAGISFAFNRHMAETWNFDHPWEHQIVQWVWEEEGDIKQSMAHNYPRVAAHMEKTALLNELPHVHVQSKQRAM